MALYTKTLPKIVPYQKFRPSPPKDLIKRIVGFLNERISTPFDTAVDVSCGSGKSTEALSPYFKNVIGFDSTDVKKNYAYKTGGLYNIIYREGSLEGINCLDNSVQLVTAAQCAHWFNLMKFYSETERVLTRGGVLAIYGYSLPTVGKPKEEVNAVIKELMNETLADYMPDQSKILYVNKYKTKEFETFLFNKEAVKRDEDSSTELNGTAADLVDYMKSTETFLNYEQRNGAKKAALLLNKFEDDLLQAVGSGDPRKEEFKIVFNFILLLGRKPY